MHSSAYRQMSTQNHKLATAYSRLLAMESQLRRGPIPLINLHFINGICHRAVLAFAFLSLPSVRQACGLKSRKNRATLARINDTECREGHIQSYRSIRSRRLFVRREMCFVICLAVLSQLHVDSRVNFAVLSSRTIISLLNRSSHMHSHMGVRMPPLISQCFCGPCALISIHLRSFHSR